MAPLWLLSCFALVGAAFGECQGAFRASQVVLVVESLPPDAGNMRDAGSIPGSGRCPGGGHGNGLQYSCLRIPWTEEPGGLQPIGLYSWTQVR